MNWNKFGFLLLVFFVLCVITQFNRWADKKVEETKSTPHNHEVYDRVVKSGELKVGYLTLPHFMEKSTDGKMSGIYYDITEEMGRRLNLKIKWVEEVNLATLSEGLENKRYDMIAFALWRSSDRVKKVSFSVPLYYSTVGCYVRANDKRFDNDLNRLNYSNIKISVIDGELAESIAKSDYPKATFASLPPLADYSQMLLQVASKKADATFYDDVLSKRYITSNPGSIKKVSKQPVRVFANCYVLPIDDYVFQTMINETISELIENGFVEKAFKNNGENPEEYNMTSIPYRSQDK